MTRMQEDTKRAVLGDLRQAHEIAEVAGLGPEVMQRDLICWKAEGRIFSVEFEGTEYFPPFALDSATGYQPYPALAEVLRILNRGNWGSDRAVAAWFIGLSSFLDDQRPGDLLATDPGWVIEAAQDAVHSLDQRSW